MEFAAPAHRQDWAMIVRIGISESNTYSFKPRGLDPART